MPDLHFEAPLNNKQPTTDYMMDLVEQVHDISYYACQRVKMASYMTKVRYDYLCDLVGFYGEHRVWLYCLTRTRGKSPKLQPFLEGP
jgi:hypothetical protein